MKLGVQIAALREANAGTLMITPMAFTAEERLAKLRAIAELAN